MLNGDVESRESVDSIDPASVTFTSKTDKYKDDNGRDQKPSSSTHTVCNADLLQPTPMLPSPASNRASSMT
jgi:hypothetical protein